MYIWHLRGRLTSDLAPLAPGQALYKELALLSLTVAWSEDGKTAPTAPSAPVANLYIDRQDHSSCRTDSQTEQCSFSGNPKHHSYEPGVTPNRAGLLTKLPVLLLYQPWCCSPCSSPQWPSKTPLPRNLLQLSPQSYSVAHNTGMTGLQSYSIPRKTAKYGSTSIQTLMLSLRNLSDQKNQSNQSRSMPQQ